jgi:hypothetical protein
MTAITESVAENLVRRRVMASRPQYSPAGGDGIIVAAERQECICPMQMIDSAGRSGGDSLIEIVDRDMGLTSLKCQDAKSVHSVGIAGLDCQDLAVDLLCFCEPPNFVQELALSEQHVDLL